MRGRVIGVLLEIILPLSILSLMVGMANATMVSQNLDLKALTLKASKVVEAKCISVSEDPSSPNLIYTFQVTRILKGRKRTSTVKVRIPGGHIGEYNLYVPGVTNAAPKVSESMLLFLGRWNGGYFPVGYWKGMKRISRDREGHEVVEVEKGEWQPLSEVRSMVLRVVEGATGP